MYESLKTFCKFLEKEKLLHRIQEPISVVHEVTHLHNLVLKKNGPALLLENPILPNGQISTIPMLVNLFGTTERIALAITQNKVTRRTKEDLRNFGKLLAFLKEPKAPRNFKEAFAMWPVMKNALSMRPKYIKKALCPCHEKIFDKDDVDITRLPIQVCWPQEPSPLITWGVVITKDVEDETINLGVYRMQVLDKKRVIVRWLAHRGGALHYAKWKRIKGEDVPFPVAVVIGADPSILLAAVTPVPDTLSEYQFAGLLRGGKISVTPAVSIDIPVPAYADIVLEGTICNEYADEGPFGDHTGYYNSVEKFPILNINVMTTQENPIYLSTFTGRPPDEPSVLGQALNEVFIPLLQQNFPEIKDCYLVPEACSYRIAVISIKKSYPGHAKRIMMGLWSSLRQFMYTKMIIVVDDDIDIRCWKDVVWAISTRMDFIRDVLTIPDTPIDYLDFASQKENLGSKIGFDATNKWPQETTRVWGKPINAHPDPATLEKINSIVMSF